MGFYVNLNILPHQINPQDWKEIYEETVVFLQDPAVEAMGIQVEEIYGMENRVFSRKIEHSVENSNKRFWNVLGDFKTKQRAESFILRYDLSFYVTDKQAEISNDIIPAITTSKTRGIFFDKTQGYSYHIPILAVAMLIEDRFPQYAIVGGDIDIEQAKEAQILLKQVINRDVVLPVVVDSQRLYQRILQHFSAEKAIENFNHLFRGDRELVYRTILELTPKEDIVKKWLMQQLKAFDSSNRLGAISLIIHWLNATHDLETLCQIACVDPEGPHYNPVEFVDTLAGTWLTIDTNLRVLEKPIESVGEQFTAAFLDMSGFKGRNMHTYMEENHVLSVFNQLFPVQFKELKTVFQKRCSQEKEKLQLLQKQLTDLAPSSDVPSIENATAFNEPLTTPPPMIEPAAKWYIKVRTNFREKFSETLKGPIENLKKSIVKMATTQDLIFTEDAWAWIRQENQHELLEFILLLVAIKSDTLVFHELRNSMLENKNYCVETLAYSKKIQPGF